MEPSAASSGAAGAEVTAPKHLGEQPNTQLSGWLRSELFLTQRPQMQNLGNGRYGLRALDVYPFYQSIELRADEVYHRGLSVHFQGWAGYDLADIYFDDRFVGEPVYLYLEFRDYGLNGRVGRHMLFAGTTRGLHLDGVHASYESADHVGFEALGGLPVTARRGPEWYREQPEVDFDDFGAGFSDWERQGEYAAGGRLFYRVPGLISTGVSVLHVTEQEEVDRQLLGTDLDATPLEWAGLTGNLSLDLHQRAVQEAGLALDFYPTDTLSFTTEYRHTDPTLFLSHMSIFSVFSQEAFDSLGGRVEWDALAWLALHLAYHHHIYGYFRDTGEGSTGEYQAEADSGFELAAGLSATCGEHRDTILLLDYRRLTETDNGLHQIRTGVRVPLLWEGLRAASNLYLDLFDEPVNGDTVGFLGDVGVFYGHGMLEGGGALTAGITPYADHEFRGMLKFGYNFQTQFVERREP